MACRYTRIWYPGPLSLECPSCGITRLPSGGVCLRAEVSAFLPHHEGEGDDEGDDDDDAALAAAVVLLAAATIALAAAALAAASVPLAALVAAVTARHADVVALAAAAPAAQPAAAQPAAAAGPAQPQPAAVKCTCLRVLSALTQFRGHGFLEVTGATTYAPLTARSAQPASRVTPNSRHIL